MVEASRFVLWLRHMGFFCGWVCVCKGEGGFVFMDGAGGAFVMEKKPKRWRFLGKMINKKLFLYF